MLQAQPHAEAPSPPAAGASEHLPPRLRDRKWDKNQLGVFGAARE